MELKGANDRVLFRRRSAAVDDHRHCWASLKTQGTRDPPAQRSPRPRPSGRPPQCRSRLQAATGSHRGARLF